MYPVSKIWIARWKAYSVGCLAAHSYQDRPDHGSQPMEEYLRNWEHPANVIAGVVRPNVPIEGGEWLQEGT